MKPLLFALMLGVGSLFQAQVHAETCTKGSLVAQAAEPIVQRNVALINEIIRNPKAATILNWTQLSNPHDETEILFFANSISNGSAAVYSDTSPILAKSTRHSQSQKQSSVVLQYLRLSLMAFNGRPGPKPLHMTVSAIQVDEKKSTVVANGFLHAYGADGKPVEYPTDIRFSVVSYPEEEYGKYKKMPRFCISLSDVVVGNQSVFGWWYDPASAGGAPPVSPRRAMEWTPPTHGIESCQTEVSIKQSRGRESR